MEYCHHSVSKTGLFQIKLNLHVRHKTSFPVKLEPVVYSLLAFQVHVVQKILPAKTYSDAKPLRSTQTLVQSLGHFQFNKNSGLKFWKFHVPSGMVHSGCTDQTQATTPLVIALVSRMQKNWTGDSNFPKWKRTFLPDQLESLGGSKWSTFKAGPKYSGRTEPKWSITLILLLTKISRILGWMESAPHVPICYPPICHKAFGAAPGYGSKVWNIKSYSSSGGGGRGQGGYSLIKVV